MATENEAFFQVAYKPCETSQGPVALPIAYYDTTQLVAIFETNANEVRGLLRDEPLELVTLGGKARIALVFFQYRKTSIGPYNEVGLAALCVPRGHRPPRLPVLDVLRAPRKRRVGFFVLHLPVTTEAAHAAGRELWGYPKFVTNIDVELGDTHFRGCVYDPEQEQDAIVELDGKLPRAVRMPALELMTLSRRGQTLLRTVVDVRGKHYGGTGGTLRLHIGPSQHPMANTLRALALDGAWPDLTIFCRHAQSLLHLGEPVP